MSDTENLKFAKTHEWVRIEENGLATTGISDFAVKQLSELVYVDLPQVTDLLEQTQPYAEVDSVKATSDVYARCPARSSRSTRRLATTSISSARIPTARAGS